MNNPRLSADLSTTNPITKFRCTLAVQEVHTKAEVVNLTLGLRVLFNYHALEMYCETYD